MQCPLCCIAISKISTIPKVPPTEINVSQHRQTHVWHWFLHFSHLCSGNSGKKNIPFTGSRLFSVNTDKIKPLQSSAEQWVGLVRSECARECREESVLVFKCRPQWDWKVIRKRSQAKCSVSLVRGINQTWLIHSHMTAHIRSIIYKFYCVKDSTV